MKELSLNILDISQNSITAGASLVEISLTEDENGWLTLAVKDDGCGMSEETLRTVMDPFYTTRTTRKVGMGIPLLKLAAEQTGGEVRIESVSDKVCEDHGTTITAIFDTGHIDMTPLGDVIEPIATLLQGHPEIDYLFIHKTPRLNVRMDTREMRAVLGDVSLAEPEILEWVRGYLSEQYEQIT